jgi:hypothetical protein
MLIIFILDLFLRSLFYIIFPALAGSGRMVAAASKSLMEGFGEALPPRNLFFGILSSGVAA